MKKPALSFAFLLAVALSQAQPFILKGEITGQHAGKIKLSYTNKKGDYVQDSAVVRNGHFHFTLDIAEPTMASLTGSLKSRGMDDPNFTDLFISPSDMTISLKVDHFKAAVITGSKAQDDYAVLKKMEQPVEDDYNRLQAELKKERDASAKALKDGKGAATRDSLKRRIEEIQPGAGNFRERDAEISFAFFADHPKSIVTAFMLGIFAHDMSLDSLQMFYDRLGGETQQSSFGRNVGNTIAGIKRGSPGSMTSDFAAMDMNGNKVRLSDFKGKYVVLDFWASWCVPCRASMPHMKELYARYKDKGLNILCVSIDGDTVAWKAAIEKDGLGIWANVLRSVDMKKLEFDKLDREDLRPQFGVQGIPARLLIDRKGMIIGRYANNSDEDNLDIDKKLKEVFDN